MPYSRHALACVILVSLSLTIAAPAGASALHVPSDYPTIEAALNAFENSGIDSLIIAPGVYYESLLISR